MPTENARFYVGQALIVVVAFLASYFLPVAEWAKAIVALPIVGALTSAAFQLWRDLRAHERKLELQEHQQDFTLATATHMATVAYDKHVDFCEAYMDRVNAGLRDLFQKGPHSEVLQFAYDLSDIRLQNAVWLTPEIEAQLTPFEQALREIAANDMLLEHLEGGTPERKAAVEKMYRSFGLATEIYEPANDEEAIQTRTQILGQLRRILGTKELTALRLRAAELALSRVSNEEAS